MSDNRSLFQKSAPEVDANVDKFLESINAGSKNSGSGRLVFALDATASRKPTWDLASNLQAQMFQEVAVVGNLSLQLVYYRGVDECRAASWILKSV